MSFPYFFKIFNKRPLAVVNYFLLFYQLCSKSAEILNF